MAGARTVIGTVCAAAVLSLFTMLLVQSTLLVIPLVASLPAGALGGALAGWLRPADSGRERLVTAAGAAVATVVVLGLWMIPSTPADRVGSILLGWFVVLLVLTVVHALAGGAVAALARARTGRDPVSRLR